MKLSRSLITCAATLVSAMLLTAPIGGMAAEAVQAAKPKAVSTAAVTTAVNINTASVEALAALNGVGEKKAADIIAYRNAHGSFAKVEDLLNVKGIGEKTLEKNRPLLTVN